MYLRTIFLLLFVALWSCKSGIEARFPMEKRFWGPEDYDEVIRNIQFRTPEGERFPEFRNGETAPVIKKLVDVQNFVVILGDDELGVRHRSDVASSFFSEYKDLVSAYYVTDRQDKFLYGDELVEILKFGLELQQYYFRLGNENILTEADDPNASSVISLVRSNEKTMLGNYNNYLDLINREDAFTENALIQYSIGIDYYFTKLFDVFPKADFDILKGKAVLMLNKSANQEVKKAIETLISNIDSHTSRVNPE